LVKKGETMDILRLKRKFKVSVDDEDLLIDDPDPAMSLKEIQRFLSGLYPELTTADFTEPEIQGDVQIYSFSTKIADKG
jgi:PRTRC genetic system protein C